MIVTEKAAKEAWLLLVGYARVTDEAWDLIGSRPMDTLTEDVVKNAYRIAARYTHPDQSKRDSAAEFAAVDRAKHILLAWLEKPRPAATEHKKRACDYCHGEGFLYMPSRQPGSVGLRRTCPKCRGSGDADIDLHNP